MTKSFFFNFSAIYSPIIVKFGVHLPFSIIYKFCKKDFSLQPPGDPREQHQGDARQRTSSSNFFFLCKSIYRRYICEKIRSYHQKNLRDNIKVKVHKEYCDEIFFLQFLSHLWINLFDIFTMAETMAGPSLTRPESEPSLTCFHKQSEPITFVIALYGAA